MTTPAGLIRAAAELAAGVPSLTWQIVDLAGADGDVVARAMEGWQRLRRFNATSIRQQWDQLRRIHPSAQMLIDAISVDIRPHSVPAASKTVDDGLTDSAMSAWLGNRRSGRGQSPTRYSLRLHESTYRRGQSDGCAAVRCEQSDRTYD